MRLMPNFSLKDFSRPKEVFFFKKSNLSVEKNLTLYSK